ncbi:hypothetical protein GGX14DRAFT_572258 [Mycena pura]|uniref:Uncharacterized protein n=1 Tax=Mycena pura TaxID=153505 RepID=A0AAD6V3Z0_9AGAR|nr:hypothetical protein GGX14DRAFT_572258 [Mycena pura]
MALGDQPAAAALMHEWELYTAYINENFTKEFLTVDEFTEHRFHDAGIPVYYATSGFGTSLGYPDSSTRLDRVVMSERHEKLTCVTSIFALPRRFSPAARVPPLPSHQVDSESTQTSLPRFFDTA